jgi:hypothetical protein
MATLNRLSILTLSLALAGGVNAQIQLNPQPPVAAPKPKPKPPVTNLTDIPKAPPTIAPKGQTPKVEDTNPQIDEIVMAPTKRKITNPTAIFTGLDKITGRIVTFDVAINETVQFGALQITPRVCYTRPPTEAPLTTSFVDVTEQSPNGELRRIFDGWMFAASPGLSGVEHAVYDVWLSDCKLDAVTMPKTAATQPKR